MEIFIDRRTEATSSAAKLFRRNLKAWGLAVGVVTFRNCPNCRLGSIVNRDLAQNCFEMNFDGRFGYIAETGDLLIRIAFG